MPAPHRRLHHRDDSDMKRNIHNHQQRDDGNIRIVYKTMAATFDGPIGGYKTVGKDDDEPSQPTVVSKNPQPKQTQAAKEEVASGKLAFAPTTQETIVKPTSTAVQQQVKEQPTKEPVKEEPTKVQSKETSEPAKKELPKTLVQQTSSMPTVIQAPTETELLDSVLTKATGEPSVTQPTTLVAATQTSSTNTIASVTSTASASASNDNGGSSAGAKAGIAFGVLGGLLVVGLLVFFLFNRKRKTAEQQMQDDENLHGSLAGPSGPATTITAASTPKSDLKAPRVSLRPVTQFLPNLNLDKRTSKGAAMAMAPGAAAVAIGAPGSATSNNVSGSSSWERPSNAQNNPANPFGSSAERVPTPIMEEQSMTSAPSSPERQGLAAAGVAGSALARKASMRNDGPKKLDLTIPGAIGLGPVPASPSGTDYSVSYSSPDVAPPSAGAAAIAAAGGPLNATVHRVQLDFQPTMDDELGLKAGELVRILHEYDDGWALCIRLDRSQQGVVPRTCLSTRPVKPRPVPGARPGPPMKPNGPRGPGPNQQPGQRPITPHDQRSMTPQGGPQSPTGRPQSPAGPRPQSPGGRSQSPNGVGRRASPPGPSPMNPSQPPSQQGPPTGPVGRKPVPGQAY